MRIPVSVFAAALPLFVSAVQVHVYQQAQVGTKTELLKDEVLETGESYKTLEAPHKDGYIFTHWTISDTQELDGRDRFGRAREVVSYKLYLETTLTAHYLLAGEDADQDGIADGYELYWYGTLDVTPTSDTDGDGYTFAQELAFETNPLLPDESAEGLIVAAQGDLLQYNPYVTHSYMIRSDPADALFETITDFALPETKIETPTCNRSASRFAYWTVNGVRMCDRFGRALDRVSLEMPFSDVEIVAHCVSDKNDRERMYWYGRADVAMDSDTDGDGYTLEQELAFGTNPLLPDESAEGLIVSANGNLLQYNVEGMASYTIKSEPEGMLFATLNDFVQKGTKIETPVCDKDSSAFAYWKVNGVAVRDRLGRAKDGLMLEMPDEKVELVAVAISDKTRREKLYWYGDESVSMDSDTDGDGYTFAQELAFGTNPLLPDESAEGLIVSADSELHEVNLQPYEQVKGTVVDDEYTELFYSPIAGNGATSKTFDGAATPVAVDLDDDGRFDLVVESASGKRTVYLNIGSAGNPQFAETPWNGAWLGKVTAAKVASIEGLSLDVQPVGANGYSFADVDGDGVQDLLVSDVEGRVWYYKGSGALGTTRPTEFVLQHKVWGGSYGGFANGLTIAAVDWDDDGDIDLVCGTADGKLMLLNDPRIGRPVNVRAEPGATSVVLTWDPNVNSRVRGYGIYRGVESNTYDQVQSLWPLPRYRDEPQTVQDYFYRVTGMSRFYTAGNSTPIISESVPTDAVFVKFAPSMWLNDTSSFTETNVEMVVSINNSMGIAANGFGMTFAYDPAVLEPVEVKKTGLTDALEIVTTPVREDADGTVGWRVEATGGEIKTGSGAFLRLVFRMKPWCGVARTEVTLNAVTAKTLAGNPINFELPKVGVIEIAERKYDPAVMSVNVADAAVETESEFELPVTITSTETLTNFAADVAIDETLLEFRGCDGGTARPESASYRVETTGGDFVLKFYAKDPESVVTNLSTVVALTNVVASDCHGFVVNAADASGTVLLKNVHPWVPATVSLSTVDRKVDTMTEFEVPVKVTSSVALVNGRFTIDWDEAVLELRGVDGETARPESAPCQVEMQGGDFKLKFYAKDQHEVTKTQVSVTSALVKDVHGFTITPEVPVVSTILIHDAHPLVPAQVTIRAADVATKTRQNVTVPIAVTSTKELKTLSVRVGFDSSVLEYKSCTGGTWNNGVVTVDGTVPSVVNVTFYAKDQHSATKTVVALSNGAATCTEGLTANVSVASGTMTITDSNPPVAPTMTMSALDVKAESGKPFVVNVGAESIGALSEISFVLEWDGEYMSFVGCKESATVETLSANSRRFTFAATGTDNRYHLNFTAAAISELKASSWAKVTAASATGDNGLAAQLKTALPITANVLIVREINKYDPGDINGDGRYTDEDLELLNKYIAYQNLVNTLPASIRDMTIRQALANGSVVNLTGRALTAADVNQDRKVDANDIAALAQYVAAGKEAAE